MVSDKISRSITVYVDGRNCNLQCDYCYYRNSNPRVKPVAIKLNYPLEVMIQAFSPRRMGGCGDYSYWFSGNIINRANHPICAWVTRFWACS